MYPINETPIELSDGKFIDVYPNGDYTVYEGNPINSNLSGNLVAFDAGTGPTNYQGIVQLQLNHNRLGHDSLDLEARVRQAEVDLTRLTGPENRSAERTTENERTERGVLETAFLGSRVVASEIAESRQQTLQRLRQTDQNTPLTNPLHIDDEAFEAMALGAMDVGEEAIEDIFRIPQMMADMGHLANQLKVELNTAMPHIIPSARELLTNLARNPELRNQFILELTEFLSQPEFRELYNETLREAIFGEYEEELELARRAFELGNYRVCYFHQGRFITKIILTIVTILSFLSGLVSILRNLTSIPARLTSLMRRLDNLLLRLRRMKSQIPPLVSSRAVVPDVIPITHHPTQDFGPNTRRSNNPRSSGAIARLLTENELENGWDLHDHAISLEPEQRTNRPQLPSRETYAIGLSEDFGTFNTRSGSSAQRRSASNNTLGQHLGGTSTSDQARNLVREYRALSGSSPPRHFRDNGVPGSFYASHAEAQQFIRHSRSQGDIKVGVTKDMCGSCRRLARSNAQRSRRRIIVTDGSYMRVFHPNGQVDIYIEGNSTPILRVSANQQPSIPTNAAPNRYEGQPW